MAIRVAVFLITLSGLVFEIGLTRIFSATIWYHFAFVAISIGDDAAELCAGAYACLVNEVAWSFANSTLTTASYTLVRTSGGAPVSGTVNVSGNTSQTINPGIYSQISVSGNGNLTLNPGIYVIAG